ncbi:hypothetical protein BDQ17DRAFT_1000087 [Cyathus striatus]|nr:hypothetical protein BDQ17DRAFT_1000087 [Cyathus striatus]
MMKGEFAAMAYVCRRGCLNSSRLDTAVLKLPTLETSWELIHPVAKIQQSWFCSIINFENASGILPWDFCLYIRVTYNGQRNISALATSPWMSFQTFLFESTAVAVRALSGIKFFWLRPPTDGLLHFMARETIIIARWACRHRNVPRGTLDNSCSLWTSRFHLNKK